MPRNCVVGIALVALVASAGCAQVLGIGNPETCPDGTEYCDGVCVDLSHDQYNCGECGRSCKGASCVDFTCLDTDCSKEFASCNAPASDSNECEGLDCVEFAAITVPVCLRRCESNADCPFNFFCAPSGDSSYGSGFSQFVLAGGHCVPSFCGGVAGTWYANGTANGPCDFGGDGYLKDAVPSRPGTCMVSGSNGVGQCMETGSARLNDTCTFDAPGCIESDNYLGCGQGLVCLGTTGQPQGLCYTVCDPKAANTCPTGQTCKDKTGGLKLLGACEY